MAPTESETREPHITRERTSRPRSSVPSQCPGLGGMSESVTLTFVGSNGASHGANTAITTHASTIAPPTIILGLRRRKYIADAQRSSLTRRIVMGTVVPA